MWFAVELLVYWGVLWYGMGVVVWRQAGVFISMVYRGVAWCDGVVLGKEYVVL